MPRDVGYTKLRTSAQTKNISKETKQLSVFMVMNTIWFLNTIVDNVNEFTLALKVHQFSQDHA